MGSRLRSLTPAREGSRRTLPPPSAAAARVPAGVDAGVGVPAGGRLVAGGCVAGADWLGLGQGADAEVVGGGWAAVAVGGDRADAEDVVALADAVAGRGAAGGETGAGGGGCGASGWCVGEPGPPELERRRPRRGSRRHEGPCRGGPASRRGALAAARRGRSACTGSGRRGRRRRGSGRPRGHRGGVGCAVSAGGA